MWRASSGESSNESTKLKEKVAPSKFTSSCSALMSTSHEPSKNESSISVAAPSVVYDVQTAFENMDKTILMLSSSAVYFVEMLVTHPLEVLRTQIQASQTVLITIFTR
jgi:hypothetical protein